MSDTLPLPLQGLLVLELASVLAGPSVGQFMAELGARVLKVENIGTNGDVTRSWKVPSEAAADDRPAYFSSVNWGKESVGADLKQPQGLAVVKQLAQKADVVIASYKPGDALKLGVDYASLAALNPRLIYAEITGYGPHVNRAGYDAVLQAESGFMHLNGQPDGPPVKMPVALIDLMAGHQLKEGILLALYMRERTGKGDHVQVSLLGAAVASLANQATNYLVAGYNPQRMGSEHPNIVPYGTLYTTQDGQQLTLAIGDDRQFAALCKVLDLPGIATDARFCTNQARVQHRNLLQQLLQQAISRQRLKPFLARLIEQHIPAGAVNDVAAVLSDPAHQGMLLQPYGTDAYTAKGLRSVAFRMGQYASRQEMAPPPHFGQHTKQIMQHDLQKPDSQVAELFSKQAIG